MLAQEEDLRRLTHEVVQQCPVTDMHTHLYSADFDSLLLWGIDELLTYHYLIAEMFRHSGVDTDTFWSWSKQEQANHVFQTLFVDRTPISEAAQAVVGICNRLGMPMLSKDIEKLREAWRSRKLTEHIDDVLGIANVRYIVMTNDPFDVLEHPVWSEAGVSDGRFGAALRIDSLLLDWAFASSRMSAQGYAVTEQWTATNRESQLEETRRCLRDWARRMDALYIAASVPGTFEYPADDCGTAVLEEAILPVCKELNVPLALMIGVKRQVNPALLLAGDRSERADINALERMLARHPANRFMVTMLARENQHELAVLARKFRNVLPFGCWWFLHIESMIEEMTRLRIELLGTSFVPQHSDCRVLEQLITKWGHSRTIIAEALADKYIRLQREGWQVERNHIERDVDELFNGQFWKFVGRERKV
ncbi:glucuronate isomerase [Paenibacillus apiarius]|uniref:Glucuronate isomerase n=1 Tax=Paenibacillus apiarius TaxID=46240 RepID=A0ABT4DPF4_9BACL|nr:glucuronate isomerase [Paenibacillus apiarius]MCY9517172.1 glucuronate isomerase [Paenibacillus apiarius]MCY9519233.1 glucuronate isomerase [Paenibacillus apiarius]MCY9555161.1 glucuronate isomerase [Paenibacillus apiarius]MCY9559971.1 glucuronate isomerase [Paenibacillus apiarius]MCY9683386.1 glucuronate isomerase [Paenibacillus apiarius]